MTKPFSMPDPAVAPPPDHDAIIEIRTTFPRREDALTCAERLGRERFAACVQVDGPITSIYRWDGAVETADEFRCTCKTSRQRATACTAAILAMHPYQTPELIVTETRATPAYAAWVRASVEEEPSSGGDRDVGATS
jgi:periplasmic divalent cation tolerance protein